MEPSLERTPRRGITGPAPSAAKRQRNFQRLMLTGASREAFKTVILALRAAISGSVFSSANGAASSYVNDLNYPGGPLTRAHAL